MKTTPLSFWSKHINYFVLLVSEFYYLNEDLLEKYKHVWLWNKIGANPFISWHPKMLEHFKYDINWEWFCLYSDLPYSTDADKDFYQSINWSEYEWLEHEGWVKLALSLYNDAHSDLIPSDFKNLAWFNTGSRPLERRKFYPKKLLEFEIEDQLITYIEELTESGKIETYDYYETLFPIEFLREHKELLNWDYLSSSNAIPWSFDLVIEFEKYLDFPSMNRSFILMEFALKPYLNNEFIDKVLTDSELSKTKPLKAFYTHSLWDIVDRKFYEFTKTLPVKTIRDK